MRSQAHFSPLSSSPGRKGIGRVTAEFGVPLSGDDQPSLARPWVQVLSFERVETETSSYIRESGNAAECWVLKVETLDPPNQEEGELRAAGAPLSTSQGGGRVFEQPTALTLKLTH